MMEWGDTCEVRFRQYFKTLLLRICKWGTFNATSGCVVVETALVDIQSPLGVMNKCQRVSVDWPLSFKTGLMQEGLVECQFGRFADTVAEVSVPTP